MTAIYRSLPAAARSFKIYVDDLGIVVVASADVVVAVFVKTVRRTLAALEGTAELVVAPTKCHVLASRSGFGKFAARELSDLGFRFEADADAEAALVALVSALFNVNISSLDWLTYSSVL